MVNKKKLIRTSAFEVDEDSNPNLSTKAMESLIVVNVNEFTESSLLEFRNNFAKATISGQTLIPVVIDSYGGAVYSLLGMLDIINNSKLPVATIGLGKAMSCGAILLSAGTKNMRYAAEHCSIMIHEVSDGIIGKNSSIQNDSKETDRVNGMLFKILDKNSDNATGYWKSQVKDVDMSDLYLTSKKAKQSGLVDRIGCPNIEQSVVLETKLILP